MVNTDNENMKEKVSVSLDRKTIEWLDTQVNAGSKYRSRSHVIEVAVNEKMNKVTLDKIQQIIDEFPIELFDPTTHEQNNTLQEWFNKLKAPFKEA